MTTVMRDFTSRRSLVEYLTLQIGELLSAGVADNGRASIAVSGGSTPVGLFEQLSLLDISWKDISITLVDERWVEPSGNDSNERLVRVHILQNKAAAATFIGMKNSAVIASEGEKECEQQLQKIPQPFDVLILGMGGDGHTASLFPGAEKLAAATAMDSGRTCMALAPLSAPHERMSLTLPVILASRQIFLHIVGQEKREVLDKAMTDGPVEEMPIRFVLRQQATPLSVYWAP
ncbi:MAG: 6-phosphogluconolactonase [Thermodesulfobacteriota bacterium]|nr:6-phosphogluconolactonase [Thermodesulfobacteriota bacterium]